MPRRPRFRSGLGNNYAKRPCGEQAPKRTGYPREGRIHPPISQANAPIRTGQSPQAGRIVLNFPSKTARLGAPNLRIMNPRNLPRFAWAFL